jgi:hypothetical protein
LLLLAHAAAAGAHGIGTPRLLNAAAGPYLLSVWSDPDPLRADETHIVVAVSDPQTREPIVSGVEVNVSMTSVTEPSQTISVVAGVDNVNQLLYAAEFNDHLSAGRWRVALSVDGERGGSEVVSFEVDVEPARGVNWLWIGVGGMAVLLVLWAAAAMRDTNPAARSRGRSPVAP